MATVEYKNYFTWGQSSDHAWAVARDRVVAKVLPYADVTGTRATLAAAKLAYASDPSEVNEQAVEDAVVAVSIAVSNQTNIDTFDGIRPEVIGGL